MSIGGGAASGRPTIHVVEATLSKTPSVVAVSTSTMGEMTRSVFSWGVFALVSPRSRRPKTPPSSSFESLHRLAQKLCGPAAQNRVTGNSIARNPLWFRSRADRGYAEWMV